MNRFTNDCTSCQAGRPNGGRTARRAGAGEYPPHVASRPGRRITIRELADYTGLSPAAVSYALRGMQVSAATELRVREAAAELGYEADPIARALAGGSTAVVGLLVGSLADFWNQELVRAVQRELYEAERSTLVADADGEPARELELARRLVDHRVDGLVVVPIGPASGGWESIAKEVATVTIGDALPGVSVAGEVVFDNERGVRETPRAPERARTPAHHRAVVGRGDARRAARPSARSARRRRRLGLDCRLVAGVLAERLAPAGARAAGQRRAPDRRACACRTRSPTASTPRAPSWGSRIPDDVAVAGFGDHPISRLLTPPLTSTVWDVDRVAELATGFLVTAAWRRQEAAVAAIEERDGARFYVDRTSPFTADQADPHAGLRRRLPTRHPVAPRPRPRPSSARRAASGC